MGGPPYPFRGLINCAECGCKIIFEKKKGLYIYGHCTQSKGKHNAKYVSEDVIATKLAKLLQDIRIPEDAFEELSTGLRDRLT